MRLPDNRVLLTYGYRHEPCGVRARILNAECTDFATAPEIIIRMMRMMEMLDIHGLYSWMRRGYWWYTI